MQDAVAGCGLPGSVRSAGSGQRDQGWCLAARCRRNSQLFSPPVSCKGLLSVNLCVCQREFGLTHSCFLSIVLHV